MASPLSQRAAQFWIGAFCEEVKNRAILSAKARTGDPGDPRDFADWSDWILTAFVETKHELLGDS
jgi:hypothetical protein